MGMKKTTSLKASFWKFLCMLLIGLIGAVAIPFSLILAGTSTGLITYADYSERCTKDLAPVIAATPDLADVQLPMGCKYLVLDKNYQVTETTLEGDDLDRAMEYAISGKINSSNALDYSPPQGTIYVTVQKTDCFLHISITDEGGGFTPEALHHAQEQFFMGDKSRTSNMHFGMGLYITSSIIKQHGGQLVLSNSKKTGGAQVIIKIPY